MWFFIFQIANYTISYIIWIFDTHLPNSIKAITTIRHCLTHFYSHAPNLDDIDRFVTSILLLVVGRRSRRNSISDDSQLTIENFGGSQDQLNMIGRAFEREKTFTNVVHEPAVPVRSSMADARGSILFDYDDDVPTNTEKQDHETEKQPPVPMRRKSQTNDLHSKEILDGDITVQPQKQQQQPQQPQPQTANTSIVSDDPAQPIRKTSFATLPNTTTWQQQSVNYQKLDHQSK